jgi:osmoprotectant transport system ATP-binding protein
MLKLAGVSKAYGRTVALRPVTLTIRSQATTVLIGPSGCGKSTLLRVMIGLIWPDGGSVVFEETSVDPSTALALRRRMGYVIQDGGLFPHLTAKANVTLMARFLGWHPTRIQARVEELCILTHYPPEALDRYPLQLSGGQAQRVSLMRALMLDPHLLLLDEPLGALDPITRYNLQTDLRLVFQKLRKTVVMVTHDLAEAAYFADDIVLMREGEVIQRGTMQQLMDEPAAPFVTQFVNAQRRPLAALGGDPCTA